MEFQLALHLLADEDVQAHRLVSLLREAGHDVLTVNDADLRGETDEAVMQRAIADDRVLLTRNPPDFLELHLANPEHPGIFAVYQDNDPAKNMSWVGIVEAIANVESSEVAVRGQFIALNHYQW